MTVSGESGNLLFLSKFSNDEMLLRLWQVGTHVEKLKASELRHSDIKETISRIELMSDRLDFRFFGPLLLGVTRMYAKRVEMYESKLQSVAMHIEMVLNSENAVWKAGGATPGSIRKRQSSSVRDSTSSINLPQLTNMTCDFSIDAAINTALSLHTEEMLPVSSSGFPMTPPSVRRRTGGLNTPIRESVVSSEVVFGDIDHSSMTLDSIATKQRRLSTVSEVMDSLRADDGIRRLSGIVGGSVGSTPYFLDQPGTGGRSTLEDEELPVENFDNNDIFAHLPTDTSTVMLRRPPPRPSSQLSKQLLEKKNFGAVSKAELKRKKQKILQAKITIDLAKSTAVVVPVTSVVADLASHFAWCRGIDFGRNSVVKLVRELSNRKERTEQQLDNEESLLSEDRLPEWENNEWDELPQRVAKSLLETVHEKKLCPMVELCQAIDSPPSRCHVAKRFVELLQLISSNQVAVKESPVFVDFNAKNIFITSVN